MKAFHAALVAIALPASLVAQQPSSGAAGQSHHRRFRGRIMALHRNLAQAFDSIPESKFSYKPTPAQLTHRLHRAAPGERQLFLLQHFGAMKATLSAEDTTTADSVKATWPKDKLVTKLKASFAFCESAFAQLDDAKLADQVTMTFRGQSRQVTRACDGARSRDRHGGSLQPAGELHAAERHPAADRAAAAPELRQVRA